MLVGTEYGGWRILPQLIGKDSVIYSVGLGQDISFDLGMIKNFDVAVHGFDPTPLSANWIRNQDLPTSFHFHEIGLSGEDGELGLFEPPEDNFVSHTLTDQGKGKDQVFVKVSRLKTIMSELEHSHIDVLKMDIEGCEYQVIEDILDCNILPNQLLVEFHHSVLKMGFPPTKSAYAYLTDAGYRLFHLSTNGNEYCFVHETCIDQ